MCCGWVQRSCWSETSFLPLSCVCGHSSRFKLWASTPLRQEWWIPFGCADYSLLLIPLGMSEGERERENWFLSARALTTNKLSRIDDEEMKRHTQSVEKKEVWKFFYLVILTTQRARSHSDERRKKSLRVNKIFLGNLLLFVGTFSGRFMTNVVFGWRTHSFSLSFVCFSIPLSSPSHPRLSSGPTTERSQLLSCTFFGKVYRLTWT